jgi:hypothetical protein
MLSTMVGEGRVPQEPRLQGKESRQGRVRATTNQPNKGSRHTDEGQILSLSLYRRHMPLGKHVDTKRG